LPTTQTEISGGRHDTVAQALTARAGTIAAQGTQPVWVRTKGVYS